MAAAATFCVSTFAWVAVSVGFLVTGALKIAVDDDAARRSAFGLPRAGKHARSSSRLVGMYEIAVATLLLVPGTGRFIGALAAVTLLAAGIGVISYLITRRPSVPCGCTGVVSQSGHARVAATRGVGLAVCAAVVAVNPSTGAAWSSAPSAAGAALAFLALAGAVLISPELHAWRSSRRHATAIHQHGLVASRCAEAPTARRVLHQQVYRSAAWRKARMHAAEERPPLLDIWTDGCWLYASIAASFDGQAVTAVVRVHRAYPELGSYALTDPDASLILSAGASDDSSVWSGRGIAHEPVAT